MNTPMLITYSMWSLFRNCRKTCDWRYQRELVSLERNHNLNFGPLIHEYLEIWYRDRDLKQVLDFIDRACPNRAQEDQEQRDWHLAGKVDGIVRIDDEFFLLEHKTASQIDADYPERLWTDFQIILYA